MSSNNNDNNLNEQNSFQSPNPYSDNRYIPASTGLRRFIVRRESFNQNNFNQSDFSISRNNYIPLPRFESFDFGTAILREPDTYLRRNYQERPSGNRRLHRTNSYNPFMTNNLSPIRNDNIPAAGNDEQQISEINNSNSNFTDNTNLNIVRAEPQLSLSLSELSDEQEDSADSITYQSDLLFQPFGEERNFVQPDERNNTRRISLRSFLGRRRNSRRRQNEIMLNNHIQSSNNPIRIEYDLELNDQLDDTLVNSKNCTYIHNKHYFHFKEYPLKLNIVDLESEDTPAGKKNI